MSTGAYPRPRRLRSWLMKALYRFYRPSPYSHEYYLAAQAAADLSCRSVVDIGCGWGNLAAVLRPELYIGVDLFPGFRGSGEEHFVVGAGWAAPLRPGAADCAFSASQRWSQRPSRWPGAP